MVRIDIKQSALGPQERCAEEIRALLSRAGACAINLIGSPGCGKTSIVEYTAKNLDGRVAVLVGDVKTALDAERLRSCQVVAFPIETGGACHLPPGMVRDALRKIDLDAVDLLLIENVGNLVCPSAFDIGEQMKAAVLSVPEGADKVQKYPALFVRAGAVIINKIDLLGVCEYDLEKVRSDCRKANPRVRIFETSATRGEGFEEWFDFLREKMRPTG